MCGIFEDHPVYGNDTIGYFVIFHTGKVQKLADTFGQFTALIAERYKTRQIEIAAIVRTELEARPQD